MRRWVLFGWILCAACAAQPSSDSDEWSRTSTFEFPENFPTPEVPEDNTITKERIALGQRLFYDVRLSSTGTKSCSSCHLSQHVFADTTALSDGVHGQLGERNAPSLMNVAFAPYLNADGGTPSLELQVLVPLHDENELNFNDPQLLEELAQDSAYRSMALQAYGRELDSYTITRALATFERSLLSYRSKYDAVVAGEETFTPQERLGHDLFFSEAAQCGSCHPAPLFTDYGFANVGLTLDLVDLGRQMVSGDPTDAGAFKTPSLRNVMRTAPYMHDGSLATMDAVLDHFVQGGKGHPLQDPRIQPLDWTVDERSALTSFLHTLTDRSYLEHPEVLPSP